MNIDKKVQFNLNLNKTHETYSKEDYDRFPIDSILYLKCYNRVSNKEWTSILLELKHYKLYEMIVHKDNL